MISRKICIATLGFVSFFNCLAFNSLFAQSSGSGGQTLCYTYLTINCPTTVQPRNCSDNNCRAVVVNTGGTPPILNTRYICDKSQEVYQVGGSWLVASVARPGEPRNGTHVFPSPTIAVYCEEVQACNNGQYCNGPNHVCSMTGTSSYGTPNYSVVIAGTCP